MPDAAACRPRHPKLCTDRTGLRWNTAPPRYASGMSYSLSNSSAADPRVEALKRQHQQRLSRFFLTFAVVEGLAIAAAIVVVYVLDVLDVLDPEYGIWVLLAVAAIGATVMSVGIMSMTRRHAQEMRDITGR